MFTIDEINAVHVTLGSIKSFPKYVEEMKNLGVKRYDSFLTDGHSRYYGADGHRVESPPVHEKLIIADLVDRKALQEHLDLHAAGKTNYIAMSRGLAESGIEKWTVNTHDATISYCDKKGNQLLAEFIR